MNYPPPFVDYCATLDLKLTSLRKEVLYILWCAQKPLKAYEVLDSLLKTKSNSTPPTVYRALIFFLASGIVHKVESIQSYTLCCEPEKHLSSEVLIVCNTCHQVIEVYDAEVRNLVAKIATHHNFQLSQDAIELKGFCKSCLP
jgi:Fur family zinc uptake transcriptional regulator